MHNRQAHRIARKVMEEHLGRSLGPYEFVHHLDGDCYHNDIKNLELMTQAEHFRRHHHGEQNVNAKLTNEAVRTIRASSESGPVMAKRYGVTKSTINKVRRGELWVHTKE